MLQNKDERSRQISNWLLIGVIMIIIQIILGGITRLTESGLSITEWKPVTGILPPLNSAGWQAEFDKYRQTDQFRYIHGDFSVSDFKFIFFWEWFHRLWARLLGIVFLIGFIYFLVKRKFKKEMIIPMVILFLLGALQGLIGWIMVKSGLVPEKMFVGHIELATHFIAALVLLCYTYWFSLSLRTSNENVINPGLRSLTILILSILFIQLIYGAFMSGLKAATVAPTWPDMNGQLIPPQLNILSPWWKNLVDNKITIQFIHRMLAYLLVILTFIWWLKARKVSAGKHFRKFTWMPVIFILLQLLLGILTVINSPNRISFIWLGIAHQFNAIIFLMIMIRVFFSLRRKKNLYENYPA